ncbi:MAG: type I-C CRISPR-associated protein Cas7/Csd2 [Candidatus Wallbacteria bacterium]|nr:type I-C CRISPR-associated protein Cas7/Csd2 [Candidatus Wallbacteria bacterium]
MTQPICNRYDFVLLFDVKDGNPNGDPDAGNMPRLDPETGRGLVTDVCIKRKIRNFVSLKKEDRPPFEIYVKEKAILNDLHERAYREIGAADELTKDKKRKGGDRVAEARKFMCANFFDVRTFGAVMSLGVNCGQVRGPVQLTFARSVDPIVPMEHSITRMAVATREEAEKQGGDNRTMGRKYTVPYGLYRAHGFVSAALAAQTGFGDADLALLWEACASMFEHDRSAARGEMSTRRLVVFRHETPLGGAPAHKLFERVTIQRVPGVEVPRGFEDYVVRVDDSAMPGGVAVLRPAE